MSLIRYCKKAKYMEIWKYKTYEIGSGYNIYFFMTYTWCNIEKIKYTRVLNLINVYLYVILEHSIWENIASFLVDSVSTKIKSNCFKPGEFYNFLGFLWEPNYFFISTYGCDEGEVCYFDSLFEWIIVTHTKQ